LSYLAISFLPQGPAPDAALVAAAKVGGWGLWDMPGIAWFAVLIFFIGAMALGMGNGSVFQLVPLRFRKEIGVMTGLVGAAGGLGGFVLAKTLGWSKATTGDFAMGFWIFSGLALVGLIGMVSVKQRWRTTWGAVSGARV
jgi:NNP family nitrate/nitrite transporter-like MFS transporter